MKLNKKFKKILITGGTGSFGNEALKRFLKIRTVSEIRIFSRDELKQDLMRNNYSNNKIKFIVGDVRNKSSVINASKNIDLIFHAAALKQVPSCEFFPDEAIQTNFEGSKNVIESGIFNSVKKIILLSTDKAVEPINAMGMSKALMEKLAIAYSKKDLNSKTIINCVRYGNVIASRGSVIPYFIKKIIHNESVPITHKEMTRFLLSLDDAINLVIYAANKGKYGEIFVKKTTTARVLDIAKCLFKILNKKEKINFIGIRHGEKIHETLVSQNEMLHVTSNRDFYKIPLDNRNLNYDNYFSKGKKNQSSFHAYTSNNANILNIKNLEKVLKNIVTEIQKQ